MSTPQPPHVYIVTSSLESQPVYRGTDYTMAEVIGSRYVEASAALPAAGEVVTFLVNGRVAWEYTPGMKER